MIAADTSTWIAYLEGDGGEDTQMLEMALAERRVFMPPPVLTELLSDPKLPEIVGRSLSDLPMMEIRHGFWARAGALRARALAKKRKARLGAALIAQFCIDAGMPLLTRDRDFRAFAGAPGLEIAIVP
jgi:predicted nucleic acid-binding protein